MLGGFSFVMNIASLEAESYDIAPGCVLRRASKGEGAHIKAKLELFYAIEGMPDLSGAVWEKKLHASNSIEMLPPKEWRYFVIGFEAGNGPIEDLQRAFDVAACELEIGFTFCRLAENNQALALLWRPDHVFHTLAAGRFDESFFVKVASSDVEEIVSLYSLWGSCDRGTLAIASQLVTLKSLPYLSPLRFLGYFALLESLLTHAPKPEDRYDSIIRQVKKKLALLDARWTSKIDYRSFAGLTPEHVWAKMYEYRSAVAHGGTPDFSGSLKSLGSPECALALIKNTLKAVIRQSLAEPQLLRDLREC